MKREACLALRTEAMSEAEAAANPALMNYGARAVARWNAFGCPEAVK